MASRFFAEAKHQSMNIKKLHPMEMKRTRLCGHLYDRDSEIIGRGKTK